MMMSILILFGCIQLGQALIIILHPQMARDLLTSWLNLSDRKFRLLGLLPLIIGIFLMGMAFCVENAPEVLTTLRMAWEFIK